MTKLTAAQLAILSSGCEREDALATRPAALRPAAAAKLVASLSEKGMAKEIRAKPNAPVWREDEDGRFALKVLKAGRAAVAAQADVPTASEEQTGSSTGDRTFRDGRGSSGSARSARQQRAEIIALLQRPEGAGLAELIEVTGWLPHTTRAALSGLRKSGFAVARTREDTGSTPIYRIEAPATAQQASALSSA